MALMRCNPALMALMLCRRGVIKTKLHAWVLELNFASLIAWLYLTALALAIYFS